MNDQVIYVQLEIQGTATSVNTKESELMAHVKTCSLLYLALSSYLGLQQRLGIVVLQQQLQGLEVAVMGGEVKRSLAVVFGQVGVSTGLE